MAVTWTQNCPAISTVERKENLISLWRSLKLCGTYFRMEHRWWTRGLVGGHRRSSSRCMMFQQLMGSRVTSTSMRFGWLEWRSFQLEKSRCKWAGQGSTSGDSAHASGSWALRWWYASWLTLSTNACSGECKWASDGHQQNKCDAELLHFCRIHFWGFSRNHQNDWRTNRQICSIYRGIEAYQWTAEGWSITANSCQKQWLDNLDCSCSRKL